MNEELKRRAETMAWRLDGHLPETVRVLRDLIAECERLSAEIKSMRETVMLANALLTKGDNQ